MTPTDITNAIGSVGFPIVASAAMFWMVNKTVKELTDAINNLTTYLKTGEDVRDNDAH